MHEVDPAYMGLADTRSVPETSSGAALACLGHTVLHNIPAAIVLADLEGVIRF